MWSNLMEIFWGAHYDNQVAAGFCGVLSGGLRTLSLHNMKMQGGIQQAIASWSSSRYATQMFVGRMFLL